jgi:aryl-alcohol dehydrogenase-like predicted oxidoreductase
LIRGVTPQPAYRCGSAVIAGVGARVVEAGVTYIDTADAYGPHTNEILIHDALYPYPDGLVIATKGGFIRGGPDHADFGAVGNRAYLRQCAYLSAR